MKIRKEFCFFLNLNMRSLFIIQKYTLTVAPVETFIFFNTSMLFVFYYPACFLFTFVKNIHLEWWQMINKCISVHLVKFMADVFSTFETIKVCTLYSLCRKLYHNLVIKITSHNDRHAKKLICSEYIYRFLFF